MRQVKIREAVALFDNMSDLQEAVRDLEVKTFPREFISVMGTPQELEKKFGTPTVLPEKAQDNPQTPRQPPVRAEEKALGAGVLVGSGIYVGVAAMVMAASALSGGAIMTSAVIGGAAGGVIGGVLAKIMNDRFEKNIRGQVRKGGLLLWVRTPDPKHERTACKILKAHGAKHVRVHEMVY